MFEILNTDLQTGNPKTLQYWNYLMRVLSTRMEYYQRRYDISAYVEHKGTYLIEYLLSRLEVENLLLHKNQMDTYLFEIMPLIDGLRPSFDVVSANLNCTNLFSVGKENKVSDILLNCSYKYPLNTLPFGQGYESWRNLKPLTLVYYSSPELITRLEGMRVKFKQPNEYCLWGFDVPLLMMKYLNWVAYNRNILKRQEPAVIYFIKDEVMRYLFDDLIDVWVMNLIDQTLNLPHFTPNKISSEISSSALNYAFTDLKEYIQRVKDNAINVRDFLHCKWLINNRSLVDKINDLDAMISLPLERQYEPLTFLKEFCLSRIALRLYAMNQDSAKYSKIVNYFKYQFRIYRRSCMNNPILHNVGIHNIIQSEFRLIQHLL